MTCKSINRKPGGAVKARESTFYVGVHANPIMKYKARWTLQDCVAALMRYRLGNFFSCNGAEIGDTTGPSQQDRIETIDNAAVKAGVTCARNGITFCYISVDFANKRIVQYLNRECGKYFLGPLKGETSGFLVSDWHHDSRYINDSNRHLNHNPPPCFARDMRHAKRTYVQFLKNRFRVPFRRQGVKQALALDQNLLHPLDMEAGFDIPVAELMPRRVAPALAALRGAAKTFDKSLWGCWIAIGWYGGSNYDPFKPRRWHVSLFDSYMHGARIFVQESGHFGIYEFGDQNEKGIHHPLSRKYRSVLSKFYRFTQTHARPQGNPEVNVAFVRGNLDAWGGDRVGVRSRQEFMWGQKDSGDHWKCGWAEDGWKLLERVYPRVPAQPGRTDHFSGAPLGQIDIVPATAPTDKLAAYKCLILPAWNTMTPSIYDNLTQAARRGATVFLGLPQLNTVADRGKPWRLIHGGDLRALCGVKISRPEKRARGYWGSWTGNAALARIKRSCAAGLRTGRKFILHPAKKLCGVRLAGARVVAESQDGHPLLVEHRIGKGRVLLLTVWNWLGEPGLEELGGEIVAGLAARYGTRVRLTGSRWVDCTEYKWNTRTSNIYLLNTNIHDTEAGTLRIQPGLKITFHLNPGEFRTLYKAGSLTFWAEDPMLACTPLKTGRNRTAFEVDTSALTGTHTVIHVTHKREQGKPKGVMLDGEPVQTKRSPDNSDFTFTVDRQKGPVRLTFLAKE